MPPRLLLEDPLARQIFFNLRLPRILAALLLGMTLAGAGTVFQLIFRNPLVEPGFLGVSPGAALGGRPNTTCTFGRPPTGTVAP